MKYYWVLGIVLLMGCQHTPPEQSFPAGLWQFTATPAPKAKPDRFMTVPKVHFQQCLSYDAEFHVGDETGKACHMVKHSRHGNTYVWERHCTRKGVLSIMRAKSIFQGEHMTGSLKVIRGKEVSETLYEGSRLRPECNQP